MRTVGRRRHQNLMLALCWLSLLAARAAAVAPSPSTAQWEQYGGDARHSGQSAFTVPPAAAVMVGVSVPGVSASVTGVAVGPTGTLFLTASNGYVYAVAASGGVLWQTNIEGVTSTPPSLSSSLLLVSLPTAVFALSVSSGVVAWVWSAPSSITSYPLLTPDALIVPLSAPNASSPSSLCALSTATASVSWCTSFPGQPSLSSPALADILVFTTGFAGGVYALWAANGSLAWHYSGSGSPIYSSPTITPGGTVCVGGEDGVMLGLSSATGAVVWSLTLSAPIPFDAAVSVNGLLYFASLDGTFYCVNASSGVSVWSRGLVCGAWSCLGQHPVLTANGAVIVSATTGVFALDDLSGAVVWSGPSDVASYINLALGAPQTLYALRVHGGIGALVSWAVPIIVSSSPVPFPSGRAYPPAPLTNTTSSLHTAYGSGSYVITASSHAPGDDEFRPFDGSGLAWAVANSSVYVQGGAYVGGLVTNVSQAAVMGEWLQLRLPSRVFVTAYVLAGAPSLAPTAWALAGSQDGEVWEVVDSRRSAAQWGTSPSSFAVTPPFGAYTHYRLVVSGGGRMGGLALTDWLLIGAPYVGPPSPYASIALQIGIGGGTLLCLCLIFWLRCCVCRRRRAAAKAAAAEAEAAGAGGVNPVVIAQAPRPPPGRPPPGRPPAEVPLVYTNPMRGQHKPMPPAAPRAGHPRAEHRAEPEPVEVSLDGREEVPPLPNAVIAGMASPMAPKGFSPQRARSRHV